MNEKELLQKIEQLENEKAILEKRVALLEKELEHFQNRKVSGRKTHNEKWQGIYNDFVTKYENGISLDIIAQDNGLSERTIYRYKAYYERVNGLK